MPAPDELRTARLHLIRLRPGDLDDLVRMYADPRVMATLAGVRSAAWTAQYLERQLAHCEQYGFGYWAARDPHTGRFAGRGGLRRVIIEGRKEVEVGYGFLAEFWGRGLATELALASVRVGYTELDLLDLVCDTLPTNIASRRVMEKTGFRYERDIIHADLTHVLYRLTRSAWQMTQGQGGVGS
jgi:RimJ/RimL family protein N-acetyltransferase